jgi:hypothetical protein
MGKKEIKEAVMSKVDEALSKNKIDIEELDDLDLAEVTGGKADINVPCNTTNQSMCACPPPPNP